MTINELYIFDLCKKKIKHGYDHYSAIYSYDNKDGSIDFTSDRILDRDMIWDTVEHKIAVKTGLSLSEINSLLKAITIL